MSSLLKKIYEWVRTDGLLHIETSALLLLFFNFVFALFSPLWFAMLFASVVTLAIGVVKEVYDETTGRGVAEWHDIFCDLIGIFIGLLYIAITLC